MSQIHDDPLKAVVDRTGANIAEGMWRGGEAKAVEPTMQPM